MLTAEQINTIHRLHFAERWSMRKIARHLHIARKTIAQYLVTPARAAAPRQRASKLDSFKATIAELLEQDAEASAFYFTPSAMTGFIGSVFLFPNRVSVWRHFEVPEPMTGNRHVRFLEGWAPVMGSGHSVI